MLFQLTAFDISHTRTFSLNVYKNRVTPTFEYIGNLFSPETIDECYENEAATMIDGLKRQDGTWNVSGAGNRIIHIGAKELKLFAKLFDDSHGYLEARLPVLHLQELVPILECFASQKVYIRELSHSVQFSQMWNQTTDLKNGIILEQPHVPTQPIELIYAGPNFFLSNPCQQSLWRNGQKSYEYDNVDLTMIDEYFLRMAAKLILERLKALDSEQYTALVSTVNQ